MNSSEGVKGIYLLHRLEDIANFLRTRGGTSSCSHLSSPRLARICLCENLPCKITYGASDAFTILVAQYMFSVNYRSDDKQFQYILHLL